MHAQPESQEDPTLLRVAQIKRRLVLAGFVIPRLAMVALLYFVRVTVLGIVTKDSTILG